MEKARMSVMVQVWHKSVCLELDNSVCGLKEVMVNCCGLILGRNVLKMAKIQR